MSLFLPQIRYCTRNNNWRKRFSDPLAMGFSQLFSCAYIILVLQFPVSCSTRFPRKYDLTIKTVPIILQKHEKYKSSELWCEKIPPYSNILFKWPDFVEPFKCYDNDKCNSNVNAFSTIPCLGYMNARNGKHSNENSYFSRSRFV